MTALVPCLWFDGDAEEAARFYAATFPDSTVDAVHRAPTDYPAGRAGGVLAVDFTVLGVRMMGLNGGSGVAFTPAVSFQVFTDDQAETDRYWDAIVGGGGTEGECSWCRDRWGLSWQIVPRILMRSITDPDPGVRERTFQAMMTMRKIDVAAIEAARAGTAGDGQGGMPPA